MEPIQEKQTPLVIFEGLDGGGKTTQLEKAKAEFENRGLKVYSTRNLGGSEIGEALRNIVISSMSRPAMTDFYLSLAVQEAMIEQIEATQAEYDLILLDRSAISLVAYQCYGSGLDTENGWEQVDLAFRRLKPSMVILYDLDIQTALNRAKLQSGGSGDYFENKPPDFFDRVKMGYEEAKVRYMPTVIDASQSIDECFLQTISSIESVLPA
jgi:dTMP kinase